MLFDRVPFTFKLNLKNSGNPLYKRMPIKLRLKGSVSWLSEDRSDEDQKLSVKVLIEWPKALIKDVKRIAPEGNLMTSRQLLT
jgi:hypothetical protein